MSVIRSWQKVAIVFIALWFVLGSQLAAAQVFQGFFPFRGSSDPGSYSPIYHDLEINLANDAAIHFDYLSECANQDNAYMYFYTEWDGRIEAVVASEIEQPYGPFPLIKGKYRVSLGCKHETMKVGTYVGYKLTVTSKVASTFANDEEPDGGKDSAVDLNKSKSFDGTIGLGGYIGLKDEISATCLQGSQEYNCGIDTSDIYYFNIEKDVSLQFKLDYDKTFIDNPQFDYEGHDGGDLQLRIYYLKDGKYYKVTSFDDWRKSGDLSKQITTQSGGVFRVDIVGASFRDADGNPQPMPKELSFGGYRLGVVVNGSPNAENAELGSIQELLSYYWDNKTQEWVPVNALVAGRPSKVNIDIANRGSSSITVKLVHGLSVKGESIEIVGTTELTLPADDSFHTYNTTLETPADIPVSIKGDLVTILYDKDNNVLDTSQTSVDMWGSKHQVAIPAFIQLLLGGSLDNLL